MSTGILPQLGRSTFGGPAMSAQFRLPSRPSFPNDLRVLLLESSADQPAVAAQLQELSYTGASALKRVAVGLVVLCVL